MMRISRFAVVLVASSAGSLAAQVPAFVTAPKLTIGDTASGPMMIFNRLSDARRLSDGRIVVAVCGDRQLRSYDASGKYLRTLDLTQANLQRGLARLFPAGGDTLAAYENLNTRLSLIAPDLSVVRVIQVPNPLPPRPDGRIAPSPLDVIGRFADGTFIGRIQAPPPTDSGVQRRTMSFYHFNEAGAILDSLPALRGGELVVIPGQRMGGAMRLGRTTVAAVFPDRVVIGDQAAADLTEYGVNLRPLRQTPTVTKPIPMTDSIRGAWTSLMMSRANFPMNGITPVFGDRFAEAVPAFRDLVAGIDGRVWAQDPDGANYYPVVWTAYKDAKPVARAELPPRFYPTQFGSDWVLGLAFDSTTTERVQLLRFEPGTLSDRRLTPREAAPANRPRCGAWTSR